MAPNKYSFEPDYAVLPGETIQELLEDFGMTQIELAKRMGRPPEQVSRLINGHISIEPTTALQLERVLSMPASFWLNLQSQYDERIAREKESGRLQSQIAWAKTFPVKAMQKGGWLKPWESDEQLVSRLLDYFGIASSDKFEEVCVPIACRKSKAYQSDPSAVAAWIRFGQRAARSENIPAFNMHKFDRALSAIREFTLLDIAQAMPETISLCRASGVLVLLVPELPGLRLNGAAHWYGNHPIIQLTIRGKRDDILWFSFFHEAGHIVLHPKNSIFIECGLRRDRLEEEADRFASDRLIKQESWDNFIASEISPNRVEELSRQEKISTSIIVGRLFYEKVLDKSDYSAYNKYFRRIQWRSPGPERSDSNLP